ncbi:MAG: hypothetical protein IJA26_08670 [Clostridia bacterium]|nr:hypothetical protein [Clostridia bacterium]
MKRILETFKSARKIEIVLLVVFVAAALVFVMEKGTFVPAAAGEDEIRLQRLLSQIEGSGDVSVMLSSGAGGYTGCVVVADGAADMRVIIKMQRAIQAAVNIPPENIELIPSGG